MSVPIPAQVDSKFGQFKRWYENKHKNTKISICFSLGDALVAMRPPDRPRPYDLRVSTLSMFILLLFNDAEASEQGLSVAAIMEKL